MTAAQLSAFQRWSILAGAAILLSLAMGMRQSFGLFQPSILHDTAITTADFSLATALQNVVWGISQPIVGTPDDCLQQIAELRALTGMDHLITEFSFGGMPHEEAELNMRLFADRVMPVLQRDATFTAAVTPRRAAGTQADVFAPA